MLLRLVSLLCTSGFLSLLSAWACVRLKGANPLSWCLVRSSVSFSEVSRGNGIFVALFCRSLERRWVVKHVITSTLYLGCGTFGFDFLCISELDVGESTCYVNTFSPNHAKKTFPLQ